MVVGCWGKAFREDEVDDMAAGKKKFGANDAWPLAADRNMRLVGCDMASGPDSCALLGLGDPAAIAAAQRGIYLAVPVFHPDPSREIRKKLSDWMLESDTTANALAKFEVEMMTPDDGAGAIGVQRLPKEGWLGSDGFQNLKREELGLDRVGRAYLVVDAFRKCLAGGVSDQ